MQAYVRLFQERFAAVNNDIVLSNTRAARGPGHNVEGLCYK